MSEYEKQFLAELRDLLERYDVELEADDCFPGYPECGEDIRINAYASPRMGCMANTSIDIDLGKAFNAETELG